MGASKKIAGFAAKIGGKFEPSRMQPNWLLENKIINKSQLAEVELVQLDSNETRFIIFDTTYDVDSESLHIFSAKQTSQFVVEQLIKISKFYSDTSSKFLTINRYKRCMFQNESDVIQISKKLIPLHPWKNLLPGAQSSDLRYKTGLRELNMTALESIKSGIIKKSIHIKPVRSKELFVLVRFQYSIDNKKTTVLDFQKLLSTEYEIRVSEADTIIDNIVGG